MQGVHNQNLYIELSRLASNKKPLTRSAGSPLSRIVYWAHKAGIEQQTTEKICKECIIKDRILGPSRLARNKIPLKRSAGSAFSKIVYWAQQAGKEQETTEKIIREWIINDSILGPAGGQGTRNYRKDMQGVHNQKAYIMLRNGLNRAYCSVSARLKCQF